MSTTAIPGAMAREDERITAEDPLCAAFARDGFLPPVPLFTRRACKRVATYLHGTEYPAPADWAKGRAVHERFLYEVATDPGLIHLVTTLLGPDVVLWGASAVRRTPGAVHPWHSDIESSHPGGRCVTAWIGIDHTTRDSALAVISRSHRLGRTVQEAQQTAGLRRGEVTPDLLLEIARADQPEAMLVQPDMADGDALLFDGRLWHGSHNTRRRGARLALLLQFAAADDPIRIPDLSQLNWPFRFRSAPRPPAILVAGTDATARNRLVSPPPPLSTGDPMVGTVVHSFALPVDAPAKPWQPFPAFRGPTTSVADMSCHASVLAPGHSPHPPHAHIEEELLVSLHGEVELIIASGPSDPMPRRETLRPGSFVYYPAWQHHTIRNAGPGPAAYLMLKWRGSGVARSATLGTVVQRLESSPVAEAPRPRTMHRLLDGSTGWLGALHAHVTELQPDAGYAAHVDAYDVAIVVLSGTVESVGARVGPQSVLYFAAGEPHDMRNVGSEPARYLVFEFHATGGVPAAAVRGSRAAMAARLVRGGARVARALARRMGVSSLHSRVAPR